MTHNGVLISLINRPWIGLRLNRGAKEIKRLRICTLKSRTVNKLEMERRNLPMNSQKKLNSLYKTMNKCLIMMVVLLI